MRKNRLERIRQLIEEHEIRNQAELMQRLEREGFSTSQGTLSRDIQSLNLRKVRNKGGQLIYTNDATPISSRRETKGRELRHLAGRGFLSIGFSHNVAVIRTRPGYAGGIASDIDELTHDLVLGSVAGDDTIIIVPFEQVTRQQLLDALSEFLPIQG